MTFLLLLAGAYTGAACILLALAPVWASNLGVPTSEMRSSIWHALVAAPLLFFGLLATLALLASA